MKLWKTVALSLVLLVGAGGALKIYADPVSTFSVEQAAVNENFSKTLPRKVKGPGFEAEFKAMNVDFLDSGLTRVSVSGDLSGYTISGPADFTAEGRVRLKDGALWFTEPEITHLRYGDIHIAPDRPPLPPGAAMLAGIARDGLAFQIGFRPVMGLQGRGQIMEALSQSITEIRAAEGRMIISFNTASFLTALATKNWPMMAGALVALMSLMVAIRAFLRKSKPE